MSQGEQITVLPLCTLILYKCVQVQVPLFCSPPLQRDKGQGMVSKRQQHGYYIMILTLILLWMLSGITYLLYSRYVVHWQFLQWALEFFVISCCCPVHNLFLPARCSLRTQQVVISVEWRGGIKHFWISLTEKYNVLLLGKAIKIHFMLSSTL